MRLSSNSEKNCLVRNLLNYYDFCRPQFLIYILVSKLVLIVNFTQTVVIWDKRLAQITEAAVHICEKFSSLLIDGRIPSLLWTEPSLGRVVVPRLCLKHSGIEESKSGYSVPARSLLHLLPSYPCPARVPVLTSLKDDL